MTWIFFICACHQDNEGNRRGASPSTERYDRDEKFSHYRRIPSLASYVVISQEEQRLEVFSRNADGSWTLRETGEGAAALDDIGCTLSVEAVCRNPLR